MFGVKPCALPGDALLRRYVDSGDYTDCFCIDIQAGVTQAQFIEAFYTTWIFKLERLILQRFLGRPSSDEDARRLAAASANGFAAWTVEGRSDDQLLLCDYAGQTRSWLMTTASPERDSHTRLYFGSAIVKSKNPNGGDKTLGPVFKLLLGFHKLYSRLLLRAASSRLRQTSKQAATRVDD